MEEQTNPIILTTFISLLLLFFLIKWLQKPNKNLPPPPLKLPIIGNLHQLGSLPHRNLQTLAQKHGHLMHLRLGATAVLIVSSADAAKDIMKTHDLAFADRPVYKVFKKLLYDCRDVSVAPYGEYWRQMKSIFVLQLLSSKRVGSFRRVGEEEVEILIKKVDQEIFYSNYLQFAIY